MIKNFALISLCIVLNACASTVVKYKYNPSPSIAGDTYSNSENTNGVVLLSVNWSREWNCGGYETAELRSIGFDLLPSKQANDDSAPDLVVNGAADYPDYINYAFQLAPGEYAISYIQIKVARSVNDVGYLNISRSDLLPDKGSFTVSGSEVVYIGHFHIDCAASPILWRYYIETDDEFQSYVKSFKKHYPFLDTENVQYRLFKTRSFGRNFQL